MRLDEEIVDTVDRILERSKNYGLNLSRAEFVQHCLIRVLYNYSENEKIEDGALHIGRILQDTPTPDEINDWLDRI